MQKALISLIFLLISSIGTNVFATTDIILSIIAEDVEDVVKSFNQSQSDYRVVIKRQKFRNWRYAINHFQFTYNKASQGDKNWITDIAFIDNNWLEGMIKNGWLQDLTGEIDQQNNFIKGLAEAATVNGRLYAVPYSNKGQVLFYRKDLHEKHGLSPPKTLEELEHTAKILLDKENLDHGVTIHYSAIHLDILPFIWSNGGGIIQHADVVIDSPANNEVIKKFQELSQKGIFPKPQSFVDLKGGYRNAMNLFLQGKSAYIITWNNRIERFEKSPLAGRFGIIPIPPFKPGQKSYSVIGSWYFAINSYGKNKVGAYRFLNYFYSNKNQINHALNSNSYIPVTPYAYNNYRLKNKNPYLKDLEKAMGNMRHRLKHQKEAQIGEILEITFQEIIVQNKSVQEMLGFAKKRISLILDPSRQ